MNELLVPGLAVLAFVVGAVLAWLIAAGWGKRTVDAAVARTESAGQAELVQLRERLRAGDEIRRSDQAAIAESKREADVLRDGLARERDEAAKLGERATRVPGLESEVARLLAELRASAAELLRFSSDAAQKGQAAASLARQVSELEAVQQGTAAKLDQALQALSAVGERKATLEEQAVRIPGLERDLASATAEVGRLHGELTELRTRLDAEREGAAAKLALLMNAKEALTDQFKSLAADILEEKSKRFAEQNQATLGQLLAPLRTQLSEFKGKVEEVYVQEGKDRSALSEQVRQLVGLNQALSQDARNLTLALKGSAKTQGNWGELVLERVLEASGLRKGHEYHVQESQQREDGTRAQADVVINLPEERRLVVDAKVSLLAYEAHTTAATDEDRGHAVRRHLDSVKTHIKGLSGKQYQTLYGLKSLDFVLMFIPVEPAFMMAVTHDNALFMDAWDRNVLLVSPSTLLFVVRTVAHLWRQEQQRSNSQEIAKRGAELYDRLVGFVDDLQAVGNRLAQAQLAFESAHRKLSVGKGNVIRQAEMLKGLGVKPSKSLPAQLAELAGVDDGSGVDQPTTEGGLPSIGVVRPLAPPDSDSLPATV